MQRRTFIAGTAGLAAGTLLAGCGNAGGGGKTEIKLFHRWPNEPNKSYFEGLVKAFEAANSDITVAVDSVLNDSYKDKVRVTVGSTNAPDVFFSFSGSFARSLVDTGNVMELDDYVDTLPDKLIENQLEPFQVDGKQVGVPISMNGKMWFYNQKIFDDNGLSVPASWDDFISVCEALQSAGITPISYGSKESWTVAHYVGTLNERVVDASVIEADEDPKKGEFTDPGYVTALELFSQLFPYMNDNPNAIGHEDARNSWLAGDQAMMYLETSEWSYIKDDAFTWGTFNFPSVPDGKGDQEGLTGAPEGFMIAKNTKHPEEAKKFLTFMLSHDEAVEWTNQSGYLSPVEGAVDDSNAPDSVKEIGHEIAEATSMTPWLDDFLDQTIVATYLSQGQALIGGDATPAEVMTAVQQTAAQVRG